MCIVNNKRNRLYTICYYHSFQINNLNAFLLHGLHEFDFFFYYYIVLAIYGLIKFPKIPNLAKFMDDMHFILSISSFYRKGLTSVVLYYIFKLS